VEIYEPDLQLILATRGLHSRLPQDLANLMAEIECEEDLGNKFMRMFFVLQSCGMDEFAQEIQYKALEHRNVFRLLKPEKPDIRLLAIVGPGNMLDNVPLDFVLINQNIQLDFFYVTGSPDVWKRIPDHDVAILGLSESTKNTSLLHEIESKRHSWPRPFLNNAPGIMKCARDKLTDLLSGIPNLVQPQNRRVAYENITENQLPFLIRPIDTHAGNGFAKIIDEKSLEDYLEQNKADCYYLSDYIDCSKEDGLFRKFRVALIDKKPYVCHLAISKDWIVHYLSARMDLSVEKRDEEEKFFNEFEPVFLQKHGDCFREIAERIDLDYVILDCAESRHGELVVFEADNAAWIHDIDAPDLYPYKSATMNRAFAAFTNMLQRAVDAHDGGLAGFSEAAQILSAI
jgi:hypothetical protein